MVLCVCSCVFVDDLNAGAASTRYSRRSISKEGRRRVLVGVEYFTLAACDVAACGSRQPCLCFVDIAPLDSSVRVAREAREAESLVGHDEVLEKVP